MSPTSAPHEPWSEVLAELRHLRRDRDRGEDALWDAIDELRRLILDASDAAGDSETEDGRMDRFAYRRAIHRFRRLVERHVPPGERVAVASRGDQELLALDDVEAEHFPQDVSGCYAGFYPADGTGVIAHLAWLRARGTQWLAFPGSAAWWLESYPGFRAHLDAQAVTIVSDEVGGTLFGFAALDTGERPPVDRIRELLDSWERGGGAPSLLEWESGLELERRLPDRMIFSPPEDGDRLPYLDRSVDVVVVRDAARLSEARRVASRSVVLAEPDAEHPSITIEHVSGSPSELPEASIVIPTYNGIRNVDACVSGLARSLPERFGGEVIVVDDGSGEATREGLRKHGERFSWLRVVRNDQNLGFIGSCNRGAEEARHPFVVFLNDDTVPMGDWLEALLGTFERFPDAGAVGGRLIYPDGRLQEAGGVVFRDGSGANVGRGDWEVDAPRYRWVRPVDYCSGALLATPTELFHELGGFDRRYLPAYYEDTDYCFRVREAGRKVYYQPRAAIVHTEGATSGVDPASGAKRHQLRNQDVFRRRWRSTLDDSPHPPARYTEDVWERLTIASAENVEVAS